MSAARRQNIKRGWGDDLAPIPVSKIDAELFGALREIEGDQLIMRDNQIQVGAFTLTSNGLEMNGETDREEWSKLGEMLFRLEGSIQWIIGDWLLYGMQLSYGDMPKFAEEFGRDAKTLHHYKQICEKFQLARRRASLSFGHHDAVRGLETSEQQDEALAYAEEHQLSVAALRKLLRGESDRPALSSGEMPDFKSFSDGFIRLMAQDQQRAARYLDQLDAWSLKMRAELRGGKK